MAAYVAILHVFSILSIYSILFCESRGHDSCERDSFLIYRKVFQNFSGQPAHIDINPRHSSAVLSYMNHCLIRCVVFKPDPVTFLHVAEHTAVFQIIPAPVLLHYFAKLISLFHFPPGISNPDFTDRQAYVFSGYLHPLQKRIVSV